MLNVKFQSNPSASRETETLLREEGLKRKDFLSPIPHDLPGCECEPKVNEWKEQAANPKFDRHAIVCPRSLKPDYKQFEIKCANCREVVAYVSAKDKTLTDFCDLHYLSWTDGKKWFGCMAPQISPIDLSLNFECACGNDTRDFRVASNLRPPLAVEKEKQNALRRGFGLKKSAFVAVEVKHS